MLSEAGTKYGEGTIKKWSIVFTEKYGKGYSLKNLWRMRQFYFNFSKVAPMGAIFECILYKSQNYNSIKRRK
jgi:hypothetical protein